MFALLTVAMITIPAVCSLLLIMVNSLRLALMSTVRMKTGKKKLCQQYDLVQVPFTGHGVLQKLMLQTTSSLESGDIALVHVDTVVAPLLVSEPADHVDTTVF